VLLGTAQLGIVQPSHFPYAFSVVGVLSKLGVSKQPTKKPLTYIEYLNRVNSILKIAWKNRSINH
jgi:hypothetical protein